MLAYVRVAPNGHVRRESFNGDVCSMLTILGRADWSDATTPRTDKPVRFYSGAFMVGEHTGAHYLIQSHIC